MKRLIHTQILGHAIALIIIGTVMALNAYAGFI